jgi:hypothetical protein
MQFYTKKKFSWLLVKMWLALLSVFYWMLAGPCRKRAQNHLFQNRSSRISAVNDWVKRNSIKRSQATDD